MECCHLCWAPLEGKKALCKDCVRSNQEACKRHIREKKITLCQLSEEGRQLKERIKSHLEKNKDELQRVSDENLHAAKQQFLRHTTWRYVEEAVQKEEREVEQLRANIEQRRAALIKAQSMLAAMKKTMEANKSQMLPTISTSATLSTTTTRTTTSTTSTTKVTTPTKSATTTPTKSATTTPTKSATTTAKPATTTATTTAKPATTTATTATATTTTTTTATTATTTAHGHILQQEKLAQTKQNIAQVRRALISELLSFFPINPSPTASETETIIMNVTMPNSGMYEYYRPDALSTALGYVAHVVYVVASYLGISLPWRIEFAGSRSTVWDPFDDKQYPLHGARYADIEHALDLLNRDIVYMCGSQGVYIPRSFQRSTLPNLLALLRCPTLGTAGSPIDVVKSVRLPVARPPLRIIVPPKKSTTTKEEDEEESDFIVMDHPIIPTPEQHEELEQFERAMFIDTT